MRSFLLPLIDIIYDGLLYKSSIIQIDEFDKKERKFLNFQQQNHNSQEKPLRIQGCKQVAFVAFFSEYLIAPPGWR